MPSGELASPLLTLAACDHSLCVDLHPPLERVRALYQGLQYQLRVTTRSPGSHPAEVRGSTGPTEGGLAKRFQTATDSVKYVKVSGLSLSLRVCVGVGVCVCSPWSAPGP